MVKIINVPDSDPRVRQHQSQESSAPRGGSPVYYTSSGHSSATQQIARNDGERQGWGAGGGAAPGFDFSAWLNEPVDCFGYTAKNLHFLGLAILLYLVMGVQGLVAVGGVYFVLKYLRRQR